MDIEYSLLKLIVRLNWILLVVSIILGFLLTDPSFARGIMFGGVIVTVNFYFLARTLKKFFRPGRIRSHSIVLFKYYIRFTFSGLIILLLIQQRIVSPLGLFVGLSVVVVSIMLATVVVLKKLIFKEAV